MIPVISIVGKSNSGKTTLIERIIPELKNRGLKIGVIKHVSHKFDLDMTGKDSYRHKRAGAETVMLLSPRHIAMIKNISSESLTANLHHFQGMDILITEGLKNGPWPKIEVFRPEVHKQPSCLNDPNLLAVVSNIKICTILPQFEINDILEISNFIENKLLEQVL